MRLVKFGVISIVCLFLVIFLLSLLIPSQMRVSRAITILETEDSVNRYVQDLRQWKLWNAFMNNEHLHSVHFDINSFSSSEMKVTVVSRDSGLLRTRWQREGQEPIESGMDITVIDNSTVIQWYFDLKVKWYPWEKFGSIVFDKELGPPMEQSLDQLKKICEKRE